MSKIALKVEIDEEVYKQIKGDSVYDNNNTVIISKSSSAYYALNAIINATPITESDDCVSKSYIESKVEELENICANAPEEVLDLLADIKNAESVKPKCEQGEWIEHPHECGENWEFSKYECSICHMWEENDSDFCPNCGAEMR